MQYLICNIPVHTELFPNRKEFNHQELVIRNKNRFIIAQYLNPYIAVHILHLKIYFKRQGRVYLETRRVLYCYIITYMARNTGLFPSTKRHLKH